MTFVEPTYSLDFLEWWTILRTIPKELDSENEYLRIKYVTWQAWQVAYREGWKAARKEFRWTNLQLRESVARALHKHSCETTIYLRNQPAIDSAWAADGKNRALYYEMARVVLEAIQIFECEYALFEAEERIIALEAKLKE